MSLNPDVDGDIPALIDAWPDRLRAASGDMAKLALEAKLVDKLAPRDEVRQQLITLVGEDKKNHTFKQIGHGDYLKAKGGDRTGASGGEMRSPRDYLLVDVAQGVNLGASLNRQVAITGRVWPPGEGPAAPSAANTAERALRRQSVASMRDVASECLAPER